MSTADERFWEYHRNNPHIFELFKKFAHEIKSAGLRRYSAWSILQRVKWYIEIETRHLEGLKINDNYSNGYARLLVREDETFEGFFRNRRLKP